MDVISNAFLYQAEVTQVDRWEYGPLEIHLIEEPKNTGHAEFIGRVATWNRHQCAGFLRDEKSIETLPDLGVTLSKNPNIVIAPTSCGYSEL